MAKTKKRKRVAYLGPAGSFTHEAAMSRLPNYELVEKSTLNDVFDSVFVDEVDYAVLPVENSTRGIISLTYHKLVEQGQNPRVKIQGEIYHMISHNLGAVATIPLDSIKHIHSKKEACDQCRDWISRNLPTDIKFTIESSTSHGAEVIASKGERERVVISSNLALELYGLIPIAKSIQDLRNNTTRFFIIGSHPLRKPRGEVDYKVTMGIVLLDRIGAIAEAFKVFADTSVDVRSVKVSPVLAPSIVDWKDWFFVDVLLPKGNQAAISQAIEQLRSKEALVLTIRILGQYPNSHVEPFPKRKVELPPIPKDFGTPEGLSLDDIIAAGESASCEYKSTLRWNLKEGKKDKNIEFAVEKTIIGFMNSKGGVLLIGVKDDGSIHGLTDDFKTLRKPSRDEFELHLRNIVHRTVGRALSYLVEVRFVLKEGKDVAIVTIQPSPAPVWIQREGKNEFYVRSGNQTNAFDTKETAEYVKLRWS